MKFGNIETELIALFQNSLSPLLNKGVKLGRELGHAIAQVVETEIDVGESVIVRRAGGSYRLAILAA